MDGRSVLEQNQCYNSLICDSDVNNFGCSMMLGMKAMSYTQIIIIFFENVEKEISEKDAFRKNNEMVKWVKGKIF